MVIELYFSSLERLLMVSETDSVDMVGFRKAPISLNGGGSIDDDDDVLWVGSTLITATVII